MCVFEIERFLRLVFDRFCFLQIEKIVGQHGLVVVTRENINPSEFIYNSDLLTKYIVSNSVFDFFVNNCHNFDICGNSDC